MAETALKLVSRLGLAAAALGLINETCLYDGEIGERLSVIGEVWGVRRVRCVAVGSLLGSDWLVLG